MPPFMIHADDVRAVFLFYVTSFIHSFLIPHSFIQRSTFIIHSFIDSFVHACIESIVDSGSTVFCGGEVDFDAMSLVPETAAPAITLAEAAAAHPELAGKDLLRLPPLSNPPYAAFFEAHIEQGQRLTRAEHTAGVVTSIVGLRQINVQFFGEQNHAGSTAMVDRKDAAVAAFDFATQVYVVKIRR